MKLAKLSVFLIILVIVLLASAAAAARYPQGIDTVVQVLSEPLTIMLFGISLIGVASFVRK